MRQRRPRSMRPPVIVGVDGSASGRAAACLGAWEAARRACPLLLVHSHPVPPSSVEDQAELSPAQAVRRAAAELLARAEAQVHAGHPLVRVRTASVAGSAAGALVELSADASLVVVGARGTGGFAGLALGSVASQVTRHAHAPVITVRPAQFGPAADEPCDSGPRPGPVVVGIDGSVDSVAALGLGFDEAASRGVPLTAVFAWWLLPLGNLGPTTRRHYEPAEAHGEAERMLAEAVAGWSTKFPDVPVTAAAVHTMDPVVALVEASRDAGLLVVGSRGRGGFASLLLGSVSQTVLTRAHCPVAVVRPGHDG
jgi:nucleotide-binding universal stress UspA family protein